MLDHYLTLRYWMGKQPSARVSIQCVSTIMKKYRVAGAKEYRRDKDLMPICLWLR